MKNKILKRITALFTAISLLTVFISCSGNNETPKYDENRRLEISKTDIEYSDEFIGGAKTSFAKIYAKIISVSKGFELSNLERADIEAYFVNECVPMLYKVGVYEHELKNVLSDSSDYVSKTEDEDAFTLLFSLYRILLQELEAQRSGKIAYELSVSYLENEIKDSYDRYEKYGYSFYLDQAKDYEELLLDVTQTLTEQRFISALSMSAFFTSSLSAISKSESEPIESPFSLSDTETTFIISEQGEYFLNLDLSENDWQIYARLLTLFRPKSYTTLTSAELYSLGNDGYFVNAASVMPSFITLYAAATRSLNDLGEYSSKASTDGNAKAALNAVFANEELLDDLLLAAELHLATKSDSELSAIKSLGRYEDFLSFEEGERKLTSLELKDALRTLMTSENEGVAEEIASLVRSYLFSLAPYATFAIFN